VLAVISFSPMEYPDYNVGVPLSGSCIRVFSTYDGLPPEENTGGRETPTLLKTEEHVCDGYCHMISLHLRPFESVIIELPCEPDKGTFFSPGRKEPS
jgi:hypothetical protein